VGSGRKGTVDEEEYLMKSVGKLATRLEAVQAEAEALLPHLLQFSHEHREQGQLLQQEVADLKAKLLTCVDEIWDRKDDPDASERTVDSWAARMEEVMRDRKEAIKRIPKPELGQGESWQIKLLDL